MAGREAARVDCTSLTREFISVPRDAFAAASCVVIWLPVVPISPESDRLVTEIFELRSAFTAASWVWMSTLATLRRSERVVVKCEMLDRMACLADRSSALRVVGAGAIRASVQ